LRAQAGTQGAQLALHRGVDRGAVLRRGRAGGDSQQRQTAQVPKRALRARARAAGGAGLGLVHGSAL